MVNLSLKDPRTAQPYWQHQIKTIIQQNVDARKRQDYITFLREKLLPNNGQVQNEDVITNLPTTTLILLIKACRHLRDWPLIIHCGEEYQKRLDRTAASNKLQHRAIDNLHLLSSAYRQLGLFNSAEQALQRAMGNGDDYADRQLLINEYRQLQQRVKSLPKGIDTLRADPLRLTPLQSHHEKDFLLQYADPKIAELCNLPDFDNADEDWQAWLKTNQEKTNDHLFAVNHSYWGFIGSVSLELSRDVGFFYYWLGRDFQGYEYGPQAVTIMLDWAYHYLGLRCCYATTYKDNIPSKKAMVKIGFQPLPFKVILPDKKEHEEDLFYWGDPQSDRRSLSEINRFFIDRGFEGEIVPLSA